MKGEYVGGIHNTVHEEGKLYLFYPDDSFDIIDLEGEKQMKDHRQIDGLIRQMTECLENAYNRGHKQGIEDEEKKRDAITDKAYYDGYNKGVFEAWDCARKLFSDMSNDELNEIFPHEWNNGGFNALIRMTPQDAIKRIKDYKENKCNGCVYHSKAPNLFCGRCVEFSEYEAKEIHVGDEVYSETYGEKGVVTKIWENSDIIILSSNSSMIRTPKNKVKKTGKHYDEMEQLLEKMRGE